MTAAEIVAAALIAGVVIGGALVLIVLADRSGR